MKQAFDETHLNENELFYLNLLLRIYIIILRCNKAYILQEAFVFFLFLSEIWNSLKYVRYSGDGKGVF